MNATRSVAQQQLDIDTAASAGLWTPDMPVGVSPEMVYRGRRLGEARLTDSIGPLRGVIEKAITDVGMPTSAPWVYLLFDHTNRDGEGFVNGTAVAPGHIIGRGGFVPLPFDSPYPWKDEYRDFTFEYFGRRITSDEDPRNLPLGAMFFVKVEEDPNLDGPHVLGIEVWRARIFKRGVPAYGRGDWRPARNGLPPWPKVDYYWRAEGSIQQRHIRAAVDGLNLLQGLPLTVNKGGGPTGPRKGEIWTRRQCLEWWDAWKLDRRPTLLELAGAIGVDDPETAGERWRSTGLTWHPTDRQLDELREDR